MIKLLADENFPSASIDQLNEAGLDTQSVLKLSPGIPDKEIILLANQERRLILTFDRDFGHLIFKEGLIPENGVIYFRLQNFKPITPARLVIEMLNNKQFDFKRTITVVEENFIRQTKF
jgi:predicted nuclease of predicted toxin-antitoxin system